MAGRARAFLVRRRLAVRAFVAIAIGSFAAALSWRFWGHPQERLSDFAQLWAGARALVQGQDPYQIVGPGRSFSWDFPLLYPLPAVLVAVPFSWLPLRVADALFVGVGNAALAWTLTARRLANPRLVALASMANIFVVQTSQWSPLLTAAALVPGFSWLLACKPTLGVALFAAFASRRGILLALGLVIASIILWPHWPGEWLSGLAAAKHVAAPITRMGGPLVLLALLRWRRPEARLLTALACVPQSPLLYETVPLFLVPASLRQSLALAVLMGASFYAYHLAGPYASYDALMAASGRYIVWFLYLPCVLMILNRPNQAPCAATDAALGEE